MTSILRLVAIFLVSFGMNLAVVEEADARRLGGGRTLGGRSGTLFNRSAAKPRTPSQQAASNRNQQARQQMSQRGGLMGLLGGLALGGLLGALFFGGAFENLNFLDLLLFGGIAYLLFRMFAARRHAAAGAGTRPGRGFDTDVMSREATPAGGGTPRAAAASGAGALAPAPDAEFEDGAHERGVPPAGFDEAAFLAGARRAFELLQKSWNDQDLAEIRGLTSDEMFAELQEQAHAADADAYVEVLKVDAQLLDVREVAGTHEAAVLFDAILREAAVDRPAQVREIWHFTRAAGARSPKWLLEGIEQLEG